MSREYEIVSHAQLRYQNIFLVRLISRTTHIHREIELGMILEGNVILHIGTKSYHLKQGDIYYVNPLETHEFISEEPGVLVLSIQLSPKMVGVLLPDVTELHLNGSANLRDHYVDHRAYDIISYLFVESAYAYLNHSEDYAYRCFSATANLLYLLKRDIPAWEISSEKSANQRVERLLTITDYIEEHFTHKLLLEDIAKQQGLSMPYLSHLFKDTLGVSFQGYVKEKRFEYACNLIATTDRKILDISVSSGFSDVRYLTSLFHERYGCTPKEFRKNARKPITRHTSPLESSQYFFTHQDSCLLLMPLRKKLAKQMSGVTLRNLL